MDNGKKSRLTVLTTDEIRENARNWSLAGDVGLLAHLEQFSERIISKTQETQKNFNQLVDDFEELHTKVGNVTNQFLALQNCQFVENRVYDEETPTEEKPQTKVQNEADQEKVLLTQYKEAVEVGIKLLDTHFHEVQLPPNSDSDDEDEVSSGNSIIWKPKNPYVSKKFPYLIGSSEWWADDHVGLRPNDENLDTDKNLSESESDVESLKSLEKSTKLSSSTSSMENVKSIPIKPSFLESTEDLFGFDKKENSKVMASKSSESPSESPAHFLPDFDKELDAKETEEIEEKQREDEMPASKSKKVDNEFTRELMAKLSSVTSKTPGKKEKVEEESKRKENKKEVKDEAAVVDPPIKTGVSLFDETDDGGDLFSGKLGIVAEGKKGLFLNADTEDDLFVGENDLFSGGGLFESDTLKKKPDKSSGSRMKSERLAKKGEAEKTEKEVTSPKKNLVDDLFDDLDDDDTLFAPKSKLPTMEKEESGKNKQLNLGWGDDDGLFDGVNTRSEDDFFTSDGLFDTKINNKPTEGSKFKVTEGDSLFDESERKPETKKKTEKQIESPSVVATTTATATNPSDDPFGFSSSKKFKKLSILDTDDDKEDDLFATKLPEEKKPPLGKPKPEEENYDADDADDDAAALFGEKPKPPDSVSVSSSRSSLFDDVSVSKSRLASVFERDNPEKDSLFAGVEKPGLDLFAAKKGKNSSLFEDYEDEGDDLFGAKKNKVDGIDDFGDDLFKSPVRNFKSDILRPTETTLFPDEGSDLFAVTQTPTKPKPPISLSIKGAESKGGSVGKLNIPGNLKVKLESVAKHISPGARPEVKKKEEEKEEEEKTEKREEKVGEDVLEEPLQPPALLKCPSKDRVKIPGRRRPQSRRARQEAIRSSGVWDEPGPREKSSEISNDLSKDTAPSSAASNPLSPSTDEEDFFKVPELDTNFEKEDQSIFKSDLLQNSKLEENLLFDGAPVLSPLTPKKEGKTPKETKKMSIFDDDDDDENGAGDGKEKEEENLFKTPKSGLLFQGKSEERVKKPLFDPEEDDEDLFGGKKTAAATTKPVEKPKLKEGGEQIEKEKGSFVDPLGLMSADE